MIFTKVISVLSVSATLLALGGGAYTLFDLISSTKLQIEENRSQIESFDKRISEEVYKLIRNPDFIEKIKGLQGPKGERGEPGTKGDSGKSADPKEVADENIRQLVSALKLIGKGDADVTACMISATLKFPPPYAIRLIDVEKTAVGYGNQNADISLEAALGERVIAVFCNAKFGEVAKLE